jgi:hypothetical protein
MTESNTMPPDGTEIHGPFKTSAEMQRDQDEAMKALMAPGGKITDGGAWNPAWERPQ